jgi:adenylate cyclase
MPGRRIRTEVRTSLAVVPVPGRVDLLGDVGGVLAGLTTWLAVSRVPPAVTQTPADLQRIGADAGVRYVLHGWTEGERDRMRLSVELNEAESGRVLWTDRLDRRVSERDGLRGEIAARVGQVVPQTLLLRELDRCALAPPDALTAQDLALRAFDAIMRPRRGAFIGATGLLAEAEGKAGSLAGVRFALVWWHLMAISQGWGGDLGLAAEIAGELDSDDPAAAALAGYVRSVRRRDHSAASAALDRVLDRVPLCGMAASLRALTLCWLNEKQGAVTHAEQAAGMPALGPERAWRDHVAALAHYAAGHYDEAIRWARVSATQHPGLAANVRVLAAGLAVLGRLDEAQQAAEQVLVIDPEFRISTWRERSLLPGDCRDAMAQRLRLAGLPA